MIQDLPKRRSGRSIGDVSFRFLVLALASSLILLLGTYFYVIGTNSFLSLNKFGLEFLYGNKWDVPNQLFGVLPEILGTLTTSLIGLLIGVPISLGVAVFLSELSPVRLRGVISSVVELLAAVPSVVYGFWGLAVLVPLFMRPIEHALQGTFGSLSIFSGTVTGYDLLSAGVILAIMIIPIVASISREALLAVPNSQREAAYALGATRSEVIRTSVFGYARSGIVAAIFLGFGRALGETMAVTMVIGNGNQFPGTLFGPSQTLASLIANQYSEASGTLNISAIVEVGLVLLAISLAVNVGARFLLRRVIKRGASLL